MSDTTDDLEMWFGYLDFEDEDNDLRASNLRDDYRYGVLKWTSQSGERHLVKEMPIGYVKNVIGFLKKIEDPSEVTLAWIDIMETEFNKRIADAG